MHDMHHMQENIPAPVLLPPKSDLVSIVVLTFNSAETILETLASLLHQNYPALEVIIADDGSKDLTIAVVTEWISANGGNFERIEVIQAEINGGICANVARGYAVARGKWIKPIAGDDMLLGGAIRRFMEIASDNDCSVIVSQMKTFKKSSHVGNVFGEVMPSPEDAKAIQSDTLDLLKILRVRNVLPAPSVMLKKEDFENVGGIDRRFFHLDDWPLWINLLLHEKKIVWLPEPLVAYRVSENSISASKNSTLVKPEFLQDHITFYENYQVGHLPMFAHWDRMLEIFRFKMAKNALRKYPRFYTATGILRFLSPIYIKRRLRR